MIAGSSGQIDPPKLPAIMKRPPKGRPRGAPCEAFRHTANSSFFILDLCLARRGCSPGGSSGLAAGFGPGMALDVLPGCAGLLMGVDSHKSRTRSAEGCEQQIRTLPSAGSSTGSGE